MVSQKKANSLFFQTWPHPLPWLAQFFKNYKTRWCDQHNHHTFYIFTISQPIKPCTVAHALTRLIGNVLTAITPQHTDLHLWLHGFFLQCHVTLDKHAVQDRFILLQLFNWLISQCKEHDLRAALTSNTPVLCTFFSKVTTK